MNQLSITNRRIVLVAALSLVASLLAVSFNAPAARSAGEIVNFDQASSSTAGESGTHTVDVVLTTTPPPAANVVVDITDDLTGSATPGVDYTLDTAQLIFPTTSIENETLQVSITILTDAFDDEGETINLSLDVASGGSNGTQITHTVTITDDDPAATIQVVDGTFSEADGAVTFTVNRTGTTEAAVNFTYSTADVTTTADSDYTAVVAGAGIIAAGTGGSTTIPVTILEDAFDELDEEFTVTLTVTSGNATVIGGPATGTIEDNDNAGVTINELGGVAVTEGSGNDTYTVVLTSEPTSNVTVNITPDAQLTTNVGSLTFTDSGGANPWNVAQIVTVTAFNDSIDEASPHSGTITHTTSSSDDNYGGQSWGSVTANITDNDTAGVTIAPTNVSVTEGEPGVTYNVELDSEPTANVFIAINESSSEFNAVRTNGGGTTLTFTPSNWDDAQTVTVTAVDDAIVENDEFGTITHSATSSDGNYTGSLPIDDVVDDESPNIILGTSPTVTEGGPADSYTVALTQQPSSDVTVELNIASGVGQFTIDSPTTLTFGPSDYDIPQNVIVSAVDDKAIEIDLGGRINHSASGGGYSGVSDQQIIVLVIDDDAPGVTIIETEGSTDVVEGGSGDTYRVVLDAIPTADVTVTVSFDSDQITVTPSSFTFTPATWDVFGEFSVLGVQDNIEEADIHSASITHSVTSADINFAAIGVDSVVVNVADSDELQVNIEGPSFGAPGVTATFQAITNSSSGAPTYEWRVLKDFVELPGILGTEDTFEFTPTEGGNYIVVARVGDDLNQGDDRIAFFIDFTVMGDIEGSVFVNNILWLAEEGVTRGCTQDGTSFCPNDNVTRGQMAAFLVRFLKLTDPGLGDLFIDDDNSIFEGDIDRLATAGITRGCNPGQGNTRFCPNDFVTRGQMAAFLQRASDLRP